MAHKMKDIKCVCNSVIMSKRTTSIQYVKEHMRFSKFFFVYFTKILAASEVYGYYF